MHSERDRFLEVLHDACKRPGLYTGSSRYAALTHWIGGFDMGLGFRDASTPLRLGDFSNWLSRRYLIFGPAWSWPSIVLHVAGSEAEAFPMLEKLYREFAEGADSLDSQELYDDLRNALREAYGVDYHNPDTKVTQELTIEGGD